MNHENSLYNPGIMAGRHPTKDAPLFGQRLSAARKAKGWSQTQLAQRLETTREVIDYYERRAPNPTLEFIQRAAQALEIEVVELLPGNETGRPRAPARGKGPQGKVRRVFEEVSRLPRRQQEKIVDFVSAYVRQYRQDRQREAQKGTV